MKRHRKLWIGLCVTLGTVALLVGICAVYLMDYYPADIRAIEAFTENATITQTVLSDGTVIYEPNCALAGLIFYPGGKVEHTAYIPLMQALAEGGILTVLVEMPYRLAVLDVDAASGIKELFPNVDDWYIGGHSLGGAMAATYLSENTEDFSGLILLGAYCTDDLSDTDLSVLSVYGSEDKVLNTKKYNKNKANLPAHLTEIVIEGGCHAYFGMYGRQDGDGIPTITNEEQIEITKSAILTWIEGQS